MTGHLAVGLGAGVVSAILFGSVLTGSALALALFYLAPLPLMLAGLGWGWIGAAAGAAVGSALSATLLSPEAGLIFALGCGAPVVWLTHLAMLSRPNDSGTAEWYPPDRLLARIAILACALAACAIVAFGPDAATFRAQVGAAVEVWLTQRFGSELGDAESTSRIAAVITEFMLPGATSGWIVVMAGNMWAAGRVLRASQRLARPWPNLWLTDLPRAYSAVFAAAVAASFAPGTVGLFGAAATSAWMTAYLIVGLAVLHAATSGLGARSIVLTGLYFSLVVFGFAAIVVAIVGLCEPAFRIRARALAQRRPPHGPV